MATTFKQFLNNDVTTTRTLLHESIPITGSIVSGTYNEGNSTTETNIKNYSHGLFQSVYDYPYLSSSANHIFDLTVGISTAATSMSGTSATHVQIPDKVNIYNQMAQVLVGHDITGSIRRFDEDGNFAAGGTKLDDVFFVNFARLLNKDEVKKGSFSIEFGIEDAFDFDGVNFTKFIKTFNAKKAKSVIDGLNLLPNTYSSFVKFVKANKFDFIDIDLNSIKEDLKDEYKVKRAIYNLYYVYMIETYKDRKEMMKQFYLAAKKMSEFSSIHYKIYG